MCVYVRVGQELPEVLLHLPALILVPLAQKSQDAFLKRLGALILWKLDKNITQLSPLIFVKSQTGRANSYLKKEVLQFMMGFGHTAGRRVGPLHLKASRENSINETLAETVKKSWLPTVFCSC